MRSTTRIATPAFTPSALSLAIENKTRGGRGSPIVTWLLGALVTSQALTVTAHAADGGTGVAIVDRTIDGSLRYSGTLSAADRALSIEGSTIKGDLANTGVFTADPGHGTGLFMISSALQGTLYNRGDIQAFTGINLVESSLQAGLRNSGAIETNGIGIRAVGAAIDGAVTNTGTVRSQQAPVWLESSLLTGKLSNSGQLSGQTKGVMLSDTAVDGGITNSGVIQASAPNGIGVQLKGADVGGGLINSGTLAGGRYALFVDADSTLPRLYIRGNDSARFIGEVHAPHTEVQVSPGATYTLASADRFDVKTFTNQGTLALAARAGGTAQQANITGDYRQTADAVLTTRVNDQTHYGRLQVSGTATLPSFARINVDLADRNQPFTVSRLNDVIQAGTLISDGTFKVTSDSRLFDFSARKDGNTVDLDLAAKRVDGAVNATRASGRSAAMGAAKVLDSEFSKGTASTLTPYFVSARSDAEVAGGVAQSLPLNAEATTGSSQRTLGAVTDVLQARLASNQGLARADEFYGDQALWLKPFGSWADQDDRHGAAGYDAHTSGMVIGADGALSDQARLGVAFAYARTDTNSDDQAAHQSAKLDLYELSVYGSYTLAPATELNLHAGLGQNRVNGERRLDFGDTRAKVDADYDSLVATAGANLSKVFSLNETTRFIPSIRADYSWIRDESYHEKGPDSVSALLLDVKARKTDQLTLGVDGGLVHEWMPGTQIAGSVGVGYDVINDDNAVTSTFAGASDQQFTTPGLNPSPWSLRSSAGISTRLGNGTQVSVNYDVQIRSDLLNQTASLKVTVPF